MRLLPLGVAALILPLTITALSGAVAGADGSQPARGARATSNVVNDRDIWIQQQLDDVVARALQTKDASGFAGSRVDIESGTVQILWTDPIPPDVRALAGHLGDGLLVVVSTADFSEQSVMDAGRRVYAAARDGAFPLPNTAGTERDGSGLNIEVRPVDYEEALALIDLYREVASMPVTIVTGADAPPGATSRQDDSSPWYGGGMMIDPNGPFVGNRFCTVGFGAHLTSNGNTRLLSAGHCAAASPNRAWNDGAGTELTQGGIYVDRAMQYDSMLIDPHGEGGKYVFGGDWDNTPFGARYTLAVGSRGPTSDGDLVCTSGANSGEHCGLTVDGGRRLFTNGDDGCGPDPCEGFRAVGPDGGGAIQVGGDSGDPVYAHRSDGTEGARGIGVSGDVGAACGTVRFTVSNCFRRVYLVPILDLQGRWGIEVNTIYQ